MKVQSRKIVNQAREAWWKAKAEDTEKLQEDTVTQGRGGSLLQHLKLLQGRQKLKASRALLAADGRSKLSSTVEKFETWHEHFNEVCNVCTEFVKCP